MIYVKQQYLDYRSVAWLVGKIRRIGNSHTEVTEIVALEDIVFLKT